MSSLLAYPVRLVGNSYATVDDGSEECFAQELAILVQTLPGERQLAPEYGIDDPAFEGFSRAELEAKIEDYGPPVRILSYTATSSDKRQDVSIEFEVYVPEDEESDYDDSDDVPDPDNAVFTDATEGS